MNPFSQGAYDLRFAWGERGLAALEGVEAVVIVDVLSFSTSVDVALERGASIYPFPWRDGRARTYAEGLGAKLASPERQRDEPSLSPASLRRLEPGERWVLPSPNGSSLSFRARAPRVLCACLRNAEAVARFLSSCGGAVGVVAAGERWRGGGLRPALEDLLGAGAVLLELPGRRSPEARAAVAAFADARDDLATTLRDSVSGRELSSRGFAEDVALAAELNVSRMVPLLRGGAYRDAARS